MYEQIHSSEIKVNQYPVRYVEFSKLQGQRQTPSPWHAMSALFAAFEAKETCAPSNGLSSIECQMSC